MLSAFTFPIKSSFSQLTFSHFSSSDSLPSPAIGMSEWPCGAQSYLGLDHDSQFAHPVNIGLGVMALIINGLRSWKDCAILQGPYGNWQVLPLSF